MASSAAVLSVILATLLASACSQAACKSKRCAGGGNFIPVPGNFFFGKECKSNGCGIVKTPTGAIFYGGGCKTKGCPLPPGFDFPPSPPSRPPRPVCCTPQRCLRGYRTRCIAGALTPNLAAQGFFSASGSCSGPLRKIPCRSAESICSGNRGRCSFGRCPAPRRPPPSWSPLPRQSRRPRPSSIPGKTYPPHYYTNRFANQTGDLNLMSSARQSFCKSKRCPFGKEPDYVVFGGSCKTKGCGIFNGPSGSFYFGGPCKSKGCLIPPVLLPKPKPSTRPARPVVRPRPVPAFRRPQRGQCCFARPCNTQRLCRCVLP